MNQKRNQINTQSLKIKASSYLDNNKRPTVVRAKAHALCCPNPDCICNRVPGFCSKDWYRTHGTYSSQSQGKVKRYRCQYCGTTFSERQATDFWYLHRDDINPYNLIFDWVKRGFTLSRLAHKNHCSIQAILTRIRRTIEQNDMVI